MTEDYNTCEADDFRAVELALKLSNGKPRHRHQLKTACLQMGDQTGTNPDTDALFSNTVPRRQNEAG
jgi:hypothetical protein